MPECNLRLVSDESDGLLSATPDRLETWDL
jgi:hypothetical protein